MESPRQTPKNHGWQTTEARVRNFATLKDQHKGKLLNVPRKIALWILTKRDTRNNFTSQELEEGVAWWIDIRWLCQLIYHRMIWQSTRATNFQMRKTIKRRGTVTICQKWRGSRWQPPRRLEEALQTDSPSLISELQMLSSTPTFFPLTPQAMRHRSVKIQRHYPCDRNKYMWHAISVWQGNSVVGGWLLGGMGRGDPSSAQHMSPKELCAQALGKG